MTSGDAETPRRRGALLLAAAGVAITLFGLMPLAPGLLAAPALAVICRPLQQRLARRVSPYVAAVVVLGVVSMVLVVPAVWLAIVATHQVPDAVGELRQTAQALRALPAPLAPASPDTLVAHIGARSVGWLSTALGPALGSVGRAVLDLSIALLGLYFLLVNGDATWNAVRRRLPFSSEGSDELRQVFIDATRGSLLGKVLSAVLQGISIGVGLRLIGNAAPAFWGTVGGFATLVPVVGNALVWVPALLASLLRRDFSGALVMLAFGKLIPSLINRVTRATISRRVGNIHPLVTLVGALVGLRLLGAIGVLIGPTLVQCTLALVQLFEREYGLPWAKAEAE